MTKSIIKLGTFVSLLVLSVGLNSCATILNSDTTSVRFTSEPAEAKVYVNGMEMGRTPCSIDLKSKGNHSVEIRKDGYDKCFRQLSSEFSAGYLIGDIIFGVWPIIIDAATGKWNSLNNSEIHCSLEKKEEGK